MRGVTIKKRIVGRDGRKTINIEKHDDEREREREAEKNT